MSEEYKNAIKKTEEFLTELNKRLEIGEINTEEHNALKTKAKKQLLFLKEQSQELNLPKEEIVIIKKPNRKTPRVLSDKLKIVLVRMKDELELSYGLIGEVFGIRQQSAYNYYKKNKELLDEQIAFEEFKRLRKLKKEGGLGNEEI